MRAVYAVIGAGPMGLATARALQRAGLDFTVFESHRDVGGLWDITNPQSTVYESAHLISSKRMTEFAEFPMRDAVAPFPRHGEMREYFAAYADHFGLRPQIEFGTRVVRVTPDGDRWRVEVERDGVRDTRRFAGVLIASGTLHHQHRPALPGVFAGRVMHSAEYKTADLFAGQRVLIVGCGNSGADIAVDAVHHAASVDLSVRRGYWFVPKFVRGRPADSLGGRIRLPRRIKQFVEGLLIRLLVGRPSDFGLPDPDHLLYESHVVVNSLVLHHLGHGDIRARPDLQRVEGNRVTFTDGTSGEYDLILQATGYTLDYPFIDRSALNWAPERAAPELYLNAFHPESDSLFMMGMIEAAGLGWEGRAEQARLVAAYIRGLAAGTASARELKQRKRTHAAERLDGGYRYLKLDRMAYYVHKDSYRSTVKRLTATLERESAVAGERATR